MRAPSQRQAVRRRQHNIRNRLRSRVVLVQHFPPQPAQFFYILCSLLRPYTQFSRSCAGYSALSGPGSGREFLPIWLLKDELQECRNGATEEEMEQ